MSTETNSIQRRTFLIGTGSTLLLSGCSIGEELGQVIGPPPAPQIYVLSPNVAAATAGPRVPWQLGVAIPDASASIDTVRIALNPTPSTLDFYANAAWEDRTPLMIQTLLIESFESTQRVSVARSTDGILTDYVLRTEIREFQAHYVGGMPTPEQPAPPPQVSVRIDARLIAVPDRRIAGNISVSQSANSTSNDMVSIIAAFNQATSSALSEIVGWTLSTPSAA
jgi:cholesterol transport system auxiliary component